MGTILVAEQPVEIAASVVASIESGLSFRGLGKRTETRAVVLHWTGGSGLSRQVHRTLVSRGLSVHFCIDPNGTIFQFADADRRCSHAGSVDDDDGDGVAMSANAATIGIEIVNPASTIEQVRGVRRTLVRESIHGIEQITTTFTAAQVSASLLLVEALCRAFGLPMAVPLDSGGGDVVATTIGEARFREFRGVLGHLHLTRRKRDPGLVLLRAVAAIDKREDA